jgi:3,4-dihydroxy 2-butanone 4-phosphate synthase/GTP cyclohydrolase II
MAMPLLLHYRSKHPEEATLVRVHRQETLLDVVGLKHERLGWPLKSAMRQIVAAGSGVIVILRHEETARSFMEHVRQLSVEPGAVEVLREPKMDLRTIGTGAQILRALGVRKMRVLSAPKHMHGLGGFGLEVVEYVPMRAEEIDA